MATATLQAIFPLLTTGLSRSFMEWLRTAGVSIKSYQPGTSLARFFAENKDRILIFDSRNPSSRYEAETALQFGCEILDVSPQAENLDEPIQHQGSISAADWTLRVVQLLRRSGRMWLRVHDLPTGYEAVVFPKGLPNPIKYRLILEGTSSLSETGSTFIPQPHFAKHELISAGDFELPLQDSARGCWWKAKHDLTQPMNSLSDVSVWSPSVEEFDAWWTFRNSLHLEAIVTEDAIRLDLKNLRASRHLPLLELWRENHVARFPIERTPLVLKRSRMVYEQANGRHPAGLFLSKGIGHRLPNRRPAAGFKQAQTS